MEHKILEWFAQGNTGISSRAMAFAAAGIENKGTWGNSTPSDPSDFNRCLKLLIHVPEIRNHFDKISKLNKKWSILIDNWSIVEKTFLDEVGIDWSKGGSPTETYKLMHKLLD